MDKKDIKEGMKFLCTKNGGVWNSWVTSGKIYTVVSSGYEAELKFTDDSKYAFPIDFLTGVDKSVSFILVEDFKYEIEE